MQASLDRIGALDIVGMDGAVVEDQLRGEGEAVLFSWVEYPSKEVRDEANRKMMEDPRMKEYGANMVFDGKRMIYGGFQPILDV